MPRIRAANNAKTTLAAAIDAVQTSFTVADASLFPDAPFRVTIDAEIMEVGAIDKVNNVFSNVQRGLEGTVAASHNAGAAVENRWTAGTYDELVGTADFDAHLAEKASQTQYGHVKVDGTTITATDGVISAVSGGGFSANCQATNLPNNSEVRFMRFTVPAGKTLKIKAASVYPAGITNLVVQVYNLTSASVVYSTNTSFAQGDLASVAAGNEVVFRVNNTSGAERTGCIGWIAFEVV